MSVLGGLRMIKSSASVMRIQHAPNAGMTLLELMIAAGIMSTALVMLMGSIMSISATGAAAEDRTIARAHLSSVMEELQTTNFDTLMVYEPPDFRGLNGETIVVRFTATDGTIVSLPIDPATPSALPPNPVEIQATVSWNTSAGHPNSVTASFLHRW